jgi:MoaA/NifB/PqqE/SkfB family radical SAM enzyme
LRVSVAVPGGDIQECNLKCIFCFTNEGRRNRSPNNITNQEAIAFMREASNLAYDKDLMNYFLCSEGEPSLNSGIEEVLEETSNLGGTMTIFTNLYHLQDSLAQTYARMTNLFVCGKLYGINSETNDYLTGTNGSFAKIMRNLQTLADLGMAEQGRLGVQCVLNSYNKDEIFEIFKWGRENNIVPHVMMYRAQGKGEQHPELILSGQEIMRVFERCEEYDKKTYGYEWDSLPPMICLGRCDVPGVNLYLVSNGDVNICAGNTTKLGNYRAQSIEEMVNSEVFKDIRDNFAECPWVTELIRMGELQLKQLV